MYACVCVHTLVHTHSILPHDLQVEIKGQLERVIFLLQPTVSRNSGHQASTFIYRAILLLLALKLKLKVYIGQWLSYWTMWDFRIQYCISVFIMVFVCCVFLCSTCM